ncbi:MAG: NAD(P)H-hydrate dehydratase [Elusimicrobia bacterium]|nr:NAD(P)H-hydrate dehydratase [Elusimicrobiota bacterium]
MKPLSRSELKSGLVSRRSDDHKGLFGHALIAAGSRGMAGAAILAARAALRSGCGLVTVALPGSLQVSVAGQIPEAMTMALPENSSGAVRPEAVEKLEQIHKDKDFTVLAIGPGLSVHADTARFVLLALSHLPIPAVVDADALNVLALQEVTGSRQLLRSRAQGCVFTPHPGEMARCLRMTTADVAKDRAGAAEKLAAEWNGVAVLKGRGTVISGGGRSVLNPTGGPGLAKGGSGDVLAGLIAGLWAQLLASNRATGDLGFKAAALGAWLHGAAGERAEKTKTPWAMTAQDVIDQLPAAFAKL